MVKFGSVAYSDGHMGRHRRHLARWYTLTVTHMIPFAATSDIAFWWRFQ